jgi:hypothetical protein
MVRYGADIVKIDPAPSARPAANILGCFDQRWRKSAIGLNPIRFTINGSSRPTASSIPNVE